MISERQHERQHEFIRGMRPRLRYQGWGEHLLGTHRHDDTGGDHEKAHDDLHAREER